MIDVTTMWDPDRQPDELEAKLGYMKSHEEKKRRRDKRRKRRKRRRASPLSGVASLECCLYLVC